MPTIEIKTCGTCRHWSRNSPEGGTPAPPNGDCIKEPPTPFPITRPHPMSTPQQWFPPQLVGVLSIYPSTPETFKACSQYQPKFDTDSYL